MDNYTIKMEYKEKIKYDGKYLEPSVLKDLINQMLSTFTKDYNGNYIKFNKKKYSTSLTNSSFKGTVHDSSQSSSHFHAYK